MPSNEKNRSRAGVGIAVKLAAAMGLLTAVAVGVVSVYAAEQTSAQVHHAFEEEAESGTELLAEALSWRLQVDAQGAEEGLARFQREHSQVLAWVAYVDNDGSITFVAPPGVKMSAEERAFVRRAVQSSDMLHSEDAHLQSAPVRAGDQRTGSVVASWSEAAMKEELAAEVAGLAILGVVLALVVSAAAAAYVVLGVARPLRAAAEAIGRMAAGEKVALKGRERGDEIGQMLRSLDVVMQSAEQAARIESAVNSTSSPLMLADLDGRIIFTNPALQEALSLSKPYFHREFGDLNTDDWIGVEMDRFHKMPGRQRDILAKLESTWSSRVRFDDREFSLSVNPLRNFNGEKTGFVVEWEERTEAVKIENDINAVIEAVAAGDFSRVVTAQDNRGFTSVAAHGVNRITATIREFVDELARAVERMAEGDLTETIDRTFEGRLERMRLQFNSYVIKMREMLSEIAAVGGEMNRRSDEIQKGSFSLADRAEEQAAALEETAATMEEMSAAIRTNAEGAAGAMETTAEAQRCALRGGEVTAEAVQAMGRIEGSASQIGDIISVIDGIAFQTNLLALNAAVEAARAGEAGKGFAVVAQEVRSLAQRCADAAQDIKELISQSSAHVSDGVKLVEATGEALKELEGVISRASSAVESISAGSKEQSVGVEEVSKAVCNMDQMTQANASLAVESAESAKAMAGEARRLAEQLRFFRTGPSSGAEPRVATPAASSPGTAPAAKPAAAPQPAQASAAAAEFVDF